MSLHRALQAQWSPGSALVFYSQDSFRDERLCISQLRILTAEGHTNCFKVTQSQVIEMELEGNSTYSSSIDVPAVTGTDHVSRQEAFWVDSLWFFFFLTLL